MGHDWESKPILTSAVPFGDRLFGAGIASNVIRLDLAGAEMSLGESLGIATDYFSTTDIYSGSPEVNLGTRLDAAGVCVSPTQNYVWSPEVNLGTRLDTAGV